MKPLTTTELAIIRKEYPSGGARACMLAGIDREYQCITSIAYRYNIRMTSRMIEWAGRKWTLSELARQHKINICTLRKRLKRMSLEEALTRPIMIGRSHG